MDYKNGTLVSEQVNLRDVAMVRWFELPKEYKIGYILLTEDGEKVTSELYMLDLKSEKVSKITKKSLLMSDLEDNIPVTLDRQYSNEPLSRNGEDRVHRDSVYITDRKTVYCYYSEKTKKFYLSATFKAFNPDGTVRNTEVF